MAENSKIEWTHHTVNLWWGCVAVHSGCDFCYAEIFANRYSDGQQLWGKVSSRREVKGAFPDIKKYQEKAAKVNEVHRVFIGSMMDIFEDTQGHDLIQRDGSDSWNLPNDLRKKLFIEVIPESLNLQFLLLTKRPKNIKKYIPIEWQYRPPNNVIFGTSISEQNHASRIIDDLKRVNGKRFLSIEPQITEINLTDSDLAGIDWVIVGGESGVRKRYYNPDWGRKIRDRCLANNVPFFFKQIDKVQEIPEDLLIRQFPVWKCA